MHTSLRKKKRIKNNSDSPNLLEDLQREALIKEKWIESISNDYSTKRYLEGMVAGIYYSVNFLENFLKERWYDD